MKRLIVPAFFLAFAALALVGCKKLDSPLPADRLASILLGKDTVTLYAGEKKTVPVTISPSNYSLDSIRWKSLDTNILSISKLGLITAKKPGITTVSVSNIKNTISVNCMVVVKDSLWADLIAYYPFNNSGVDSSGSGNSINYYADMTSTTNRFGKPHSAFSFNGVSSFMAVPDKPQLRLSNTDFTINIWVNLDSYINQSGSALLSKNTGAFQNGWNCSIIGTNSVNGVPGNPFYNVSGGPDPFAFGNTIVKTNKWHMMTVTYTRASAKITFYLDGVLDRSINNIPTPNPNTTARLHIGNNSLSDIPGEGSPDYFFKGKMDDIRIYSRLLKASEISRLYNLAY
jgi:hypothetical protein